LVETKSGTFYTQLYIWQLLCHIICMCNVQEYTVLHDNTDRPAMCEGLHFAHVWKTLAWPHHSHWEGMLWFINLRGFMSYLRYMCLFAHNGVQHMLCCGFCFDCLRRVPCVPKVASFSRSSILDFPYGFL